MLHEHRTDLRFEEDFAGFCVLSSGARAPASDDQNGTQRPSTLDKDRAECHHITHRKEGLISSSVSRFSGRNVFGQSNQLAMVAGEFFFVVTTWTKDGLNECDLL